MCSGDASSDGAVVPEGFVSQTRSYFSFPIGPFALSVALHYKPLVTGAIRRKGQKVLQPPQPLFYQLDVAQQKVSEARGLYCLGVETFEVIIDN